MVFDKTGTYEFGATTVVNTAPAPASTGMKIFIVAALTATGLAMYHISSEQNKDRKEIEAKQRAWMLNHRR